MARPGDQINTTVNRYNIPVDQNYGQGSGPAQPSFSFHGTDYWAQGITLGLQF